MVIRILKVKTDLQIIYFLFLKQLIDKRPFVIIGSQSNDSIGVEIADDILHRNKGHVRDAHVSAGVGSIVTSLV